MIYDFFGIHEDRLVENLSLLSLRHLTPAEDPYLSSKPDRRFSRSHPTNTLEEDDEEDEIDDDMEELEDEELGSGKEDATDDEIDDDLDLDLEDDEDDDDDDIV